jgi:hypothetical protein
MSEYRPTGYKQHTYFRSISDLPESLRDRVESFERYEDPYTRGKYWYDIVLNPEWEHPVPARVEQSTEVTTKSSVLRFLKESVLTEK